jgi:hypothetical protein
MNNRYCYWSVAGGTYADLMEVAVRSARRVGVFKDFHLWSDRPIPDTIHHPAHGFDNAHYLFKLTLLHDAVKALNYDYFVWIDAETYFVRNPGDMLRVLQDSPVHVSLESDACAPQNTRGTWCNCPTDTYAKLMRDKGVRSKSIFNASAGFWIVHHDVIDTFFRLCFEFWHFCKDHGYVFTEEAPIAYATHMLCGNPYEHTLRATSDVWASDWTGVFANRPPDGKPWSFTDYFSGEQFTVNPAIVHCMRAKQAPLRDGPST